MKIRIKDLRLRAIIGIYDWERTNKQDLIINAEIDFDGTQAAKSDDIKDTVNYKAITKQIIKVVEESDFQLIEALSDRILQIILGASGVQRARVEVDKPHALRFADSVSIECSGENS